MKTNAEYVLELKEISKLFPGVKALDQVSLKLKSGEIVALVGENGAGKTTLINCITGVIQPDHGVIRIDGEEAVMNTPRDAFARGISVVHQERNLLPTFNVAENIFIDDICGSVLSLVNKQAMHQKAEDLLQQLNLDIKPDDSIASLSTAQMQMVEIARALSMDAHILLLDEPTASISLNEADMLLGLIQDLAVQGVAIIYVSHKLEEIFAIADKIKVIRDGKDVGDESPVKEMNREILIEKMVGERELVQTFPSMDRADQPIVLEAVNIASEGSPNPNSFQLKKGEILGWYGLVGAGRTELARSVIGIDPLISGDMRVHNQPVKLRSYKAAFEDYNIYYLSENRKEEGLFLLHTIARNICIVAMDKVKTKAGLYSYRKEAQLAMKYKDVLDIRMSSPESLASSLSGGNQQKICVAKCLVTEPEIIIFDEPTVGIDVRTKAEIHRLIHDLSQQGKSIILISSDMTEVVQMAERIEVFREGRIVDNLENTKDYDDMSGKIMETMLKL